MDSDWVDIDVSFVIIDASQIEKCVERGIKLKLFFYPFKDSLKMLALERVRGKFFTRAWGKQKYYF